MIRKIKSYMTLKYLDYAFTDTVSGNRVSYYEDCYGDIWLKESRWGFFAVLSGYSK